MTHKRILCNSRARSQVPGQGDGVGVGRISDKIENVPPIIRGRNGTERNPTRLSASIALDERRFAQFPNSPTRTSDTCCRRRFDVPSCFGWSCDTSERLFFCSMGNNSGRTTERSRTSRRSRSTPRITTATRCRM